MLSTPSRLQKQQLKRRRLQQRRDIKKLEAWLCEKPRLCCLVNPEFIASWDDLKKDVCADCQEVFKDMREQAYRSRLEYNYPG